MSGQTKDLFASAASNKGNKAASREREPLAARMRPRTLDEYIGQEQIVGKGRLLRRAIAADRLSSVIFYGPPGSGKTTLARVIANHTRSNFVTLNAVLTGVADIRGAIKEAEEQFSLYSRRTILFVDEVHRWNRAQQDALLPWVENGTIILIGATTENPFFEVNRALVSRSRVFQLKALTADDMMAAARQALLDTERGYGKWNVQFEKGALEHLVQTAGGDARSLLNALELAIETTPEKWSPESNPPEPPVGSVIWISRDAAEESIQKKVVLYDRDGDYHYDTISAFIKSLRGRDPDAAMYWLARMVAAGEDTDFIFRRMLISACEDTGLADPNAISIVSGCAAAFDRVGMPEGRYFLAHAALYLSTAPKSNSSMAFFDALSSVKKEDAEVPNHLKDVSRDDEGFGHGAGYLYPHAYRDHWVAQQYLPDSLVGRVFYTPTTQGYENTIREGVLARRETQIAAILEEQANGGKSEADAEGAWYMGHFNGTQKTGESLTYSPPDKAKESALDKADRSWRARLDSNKADLLLAVRSRMLDIAGLTRQSRCLVWDADDGLIIWEAARRTPEGAVCGVCRTQKGMEIMTQYGRTLDELDKPLLYVRPSGEAIECPEGVYRNEARGGASESGGAQGSGIHGGTQGGGALGSGIQGGGAQGSGAQGSNAIGGTQGGSAQDTQQSGGRGPLSATKGCIETRQEADRGYMSAEAFEALLTKFQYDGVVFDRVFFRNPFMSLASIKALAKALSRAALGGRGRERDYAFTTDDDADESAPRPLKERALAPGWRVVIAQRIPCRTQHIGRLVSRQILTPQTLPSYAAILAKLEEAESAFFGDKSNALFAWDTETIVQAFRDAGLEAEAATDAYHEKRRITASEIEKWFDSSSAYGASMSQTVGNEALAKVRNLLLSALPSTVFDWTGENAYITVELPKTRTQAASSGNG